MSTCDFESGSGFDARLVNDIHIQIIYLFFSFSFYSARSKEGRGNLLLRHPVLLF